MSHATQPFTDLVAAPARAGRGRRAVGAGRPRARRVVRHQAGHGRVPPLRVRRRRARHRRDIGEQLWAFCRTALGWTAEAPSDDREPRRVEIPESIDDLLSPGWLTAALSARFPGVQVSAVTRGPVVERVSTNARFKIEGDLPPTACRPRLCAKGYFAEQVGRGSRNAGVPEAMLLPRPRPRHRRAHAQQRVGRRRPEHRARRRDHRGRGRGGRGVLRRARPVHRRPHRRDARAVRRSSTRTRGRTRAWPSRRGSPLGWPGSCTSAGSRRSAPTSTAATASACPTARATRRPSSTRTGTCRRGAPGPGWTVDARRHARRQHVPRPRRSTRSARLAGDAVRAVGHRRGVPRRVGARAGRAGGQRA